MGSENVGSQVPETRSQCPYCPFWDEDSSPVITHIIELHPGQKIPPISELQVISERD